MSIKCLLAKFLFRTQKNVFETQKNVFEVLQ